MPAPSSWLRRTAVAGLLLIAACDSDPVEPMPSAAGLGFPIAPAGVAGSPIAPLAVQVLDGEGDPFPADGVPITIALAANPAGGSLAGTLTRNTVAGVAMFDDVVIEIAGDGYVLAANAAGLTDGTSPAFQVAAAAATTMTITSEPTGSVEGGSPFDPPLTVTLEDAFGNPAGGTVSVAITTGPAGAGLLGSASADAVDGVATFAGLGVDRPGAYALTVSSGALTPVPTGEFDAALTFATVTAGSGHACGLTVAGALFCWGDNDDGQLGDGTTDPHAVPTLVEGSHEFTAFSVGSFHTCALDAAGLAWCWGLAGMTGDGTPEQRNEPVAVSGGRTYASLASGSFHTCGVTPAGEGWCWGGNGSGQLGDGGGSTQFAPVAVAGGHTWGSITPSYGNASCGVTTAGAAYCWGRGGEGQIGDGGTSDQNVPTAVSTALQFTRVTSSGENACGLTAAGALYCWGANLNGQLGDGTKTQRSAPTAVLGGLTFSTFQTGLQHTCAVTPAGAAYCWGFGLFGRLGTGTEDEQLEPAAVSGGLQFVTAGGSFQSSCGVTTTGEGYCWGSSQFGSLGDAADTQESLVPIQVAQ